MNLIIRVLLSASLIFIITGCNDEEKSAATTTKPVMEAKAMIEKHCSGDFSAQKTLATACDADRKHLAENFSKSANCRELQSAFAQIDEMNRVKPGSCTPKIRF